MTDVSVIIPAHGHQGMTRACVEAVIASDVGASNVEVIVVDDASPSPIEIEAPSTRVIRSETNLGFSSACNLGATESSGTYLLFLNNDTVVRGAWLPEMLRHANVDVDIVGARLLYRDGSVQHAGIAFSCEDGNPRHIYRGFPGDHPAVVRSREFQAVTGACMLVRREAFLPGGFDDRYRNGFEDIDLCLRVRASGQRVVYCGTTDITHLESVSVDTDRGTARIRHDGNLAQFTETWGHAVTRDEAAIYIDDGLIEFKAGDVYPLTVHIAPELAVADPGPAVSGIIELLNIRSRQVFDLQKRVGALAAELLDRNLT